jgi:hypothetical protein
MAEHPADQIDWPDLQEYPLARDAIAMLTFDYDKVGVERHPPMGALRWRVECWRRPLCERCRGDGYEPERKPGRCKRCGGDGREPHAAAELKKTVIVHADGRIRPEGAGR